jgi:hypothetical protein
VPREPAAVPRAKDQIHGPGTEARGGAVSVNPVVLDALSAEIERVKADKQFMAHLRHLRARDRAVFDRLAK